MRAFLRYSILWLPAALLFIAACGSGPACACSKAATPRVCAPVTPSATTIAPTLAPVTYPPVPTVEYGTATATVPPSPEPAPSHSPTITPTLMPPDPNIRPTETPVPPAPTPGPSGLPLTVADIAVSPGGCYYAFVDRCFWEEAERRGRPPDDGSVVLLKTNCDESLVARFEPATGTLDVMVVD
ncbi:MAG: hypothetical protein HY873_14565 [Chloroflexi bacterium]|nr:hypothetical protein [Chloroflexota bacterium]